MNYPEGLSNRNDFRCFLTVSKPQGVGHQLITLDWSASGIAFQNVGPAWAKVLFCIVTMLGYVEQVPNCRRRSKLTTSRHCGEKTEKFLEIVRRTSRNISPRRQQDFELYPPLDRKPMQIIPHLSRDVGELWKHWWTTLHKHGAHPRMRS